jgi:hypothetical protein
MAQRAIDPRIAALVVGRAVRAVCVAPSAVQPFGTAERETGLEPATSTLARLHSTTELLPQDATFGQPVVATEPPGSRQRAWSQAPLRPVLARARVGHAQRSRPWRLDAPLPARLRLLERAMHERSPGSRTPSCLRSSTPSIARPTCSTPAAAARRARAAASLGQRGGSPTSRRSSSAPSLVRSPSVATRPRARAAHAGAVPQPRSKGSVPCSRPTTGAPSTPRARSAAAASGAGVPTAATACRTAACSSSYAACRKSPRATSRGATSAVRCAVRCARCSHGARRRDDDVDQPRRGKAPQGRLPRPVLQVVFCTLWC